VNTAQVVLLDCAVWAGWSAVVGYACHRIPAARLERASGALLGRPWPFEEDGRCYERLGIRRWKDRLPEAGAVFRGGISKRRLHGRGQAALRTLLVESRRAELVHWLVPLATPVFALWNPPHLLAAMAAYAVGANVPCLLVLRYNRCRLERILARRPANRAVA
jgi:glycosyl-4,4'-diaponeurosporenoate acyltransferase